MSRIDNNSKEAISRQNSAKKYRILSLSEKKKAMTEIQANDSLETYQKLSQTLNTSIKNLRRWYNEGVERKPGCGRKKLNIHAEIQLSEWLIQTSLEQGKRVRRNQLKEQAIYLFNDSNFKASKAWQDEFIRNYDIKYQVNQVLNGKGLLNPLQILKFKEMKDKREKKEFQSDNGINEIQTIVKKEETLLKQVTEEFKLEELDEWFVTPDMGIKYEESYNQFQCLHSPKIELFHDESYYNNYIILVSESTKHDKEQEEQQEKQKKQKKQKKQQSQCDQKQY